MIISPKVKPFWFWSQKVLPLVYDDSLSYYEVLCKLTSKLNEVIKYVQGELKDEISKIISEYFVEMTYNSSTETITLTMEESDE